MSTHLDAYRLLFNPVHTGMGKFPASVTDEMFIRESERAIAEIGVKAYLQIVLTNLRQSLSGG